jgi:hypothetical protein
MHYLQRLPNQLTGEPHSFFLETTTVYVGTAQNTTGGFCSSDTRCYYCSGVVPKTPQMAAAAAAKKRGDIVVSQRTTVQERGRIADHRTVGSKVLSSRGLVKCRSIHTKIGEALGAHTCCASFLGRSSKEICWPRQCLSPSRTENTHRKTRWT